MPADRVALDPTPPRLARSAMKTAVGHTATRGPAHGALGRPRRHTATALTPSTTRWREGLGTPKLPFLVISRTKPKQRGAKQMSRDMKIHTPHPRFLTFLTFDHVAIFPSEQKSLVRPLSAFERASAVPLPSAPFSRRCDVCIVQSVCRATERSFPRRPSTRFRPNPPLISPPPVPSIRAATMGPFLYEGGARLIAGERAS